MNKLELVSAAPMSNQEKEVYRTLRTNIEFTGVENQVIAVTSCSANDGKSTICFQLASAFAENGKKILLIDADMRKSVFAQQFSISGNPKGLSHYLSGQAPLTEVCYKTNKENLYVIPVGSFPSGPTELLSKARWPHLLSEFRKVFDYIIVDTPPLGLVVDAAVIAKECDATMMVVASDVSSRHQVKSVIAQLKTANPNFLGVVLNKLDVKSGAYYKRKYSNYYSSYYGNESNKEK